MERAAFLLSQRGVVEVKGPDATTLLQGLVTNDVEKATNGRAVYAALLTPQGKIIADFIIAAIEGGYWLDCAATGAADLAARLRKYKLRAKVEIADRSGDLVVAALDAVTAIDGGVAFADPRLAAIGWRAIGPSAAVGAALAAAGFLTRPDSEYDARRIELGVPDSADMPPETAFPLDSNLEELNGVDFKKGCYVGQELTARMKHRGTARKRILPVSADAMLPNPGTAIVLAGVPIGELRSSRDRHGLALIRLDRLGGATEASADGVTVRFGAPAYRLILPQGETP